MCGLMSKSDETDGFQFAVTLLAALGTILYAAYNYFQNTPVDIKWYSFGSSIISVMLILVFLILYIFIKGYSMEIEDKKQKESINKHARNIYLIILLMFIILLTFIIFMFLLVTQKIKIDLISNIIMILIISVFVYIYLWRRPLLNNISWKKLIFPPILLIIGSLFWSATFSPVLDFMQGDITADMKSIYYTNNRLIPVSIQVTGPNIGLSINLIKEESENNLSKIDSIELRSEPNRDKIVSGKYIIGNTLDYGKYFIFIKTSDLTAGYYELVIVRPKYNVNSVKSFYLLNNS